MKRYEEKLFNKLKKEHIVRFHVFDHDWMIDYDRNAGYTKKTAEVRLFKELRIAWSDGYICINKHKEYIKEACLNAIMSLKKAHYIIVDGKKKWWDGHDFASDTIKWNITDGPFFKNLKDEERQNIRHIDLNMKDVVYRSKKVTDDFWVLEEVKNEENI